MKKGLILEGGGMRGLFSAGVMDVLMENGIEFDAAIGVSAGAAFGCNYKSRQIGRVIRYNKRFAKDPRFCSFRSLIKTGDLFGAEFCYHTIPDTIDIFDTDAYIGNPMDFHVVVTDVETGKAVYVNSDEAGDDALEFFRASASMPIVSRPVEIRGKKYLDGGIADSVPLQYFESIGFKKNVIILTQPAGYVKKPSSAAKIIKYALKDYPMIAKVMENRHNEYNETLVLIEERKKSGDVLVIQPDGPLEIGRVEHNPDVMQKAYDQGRAVATRMLDEIKNFMK
ncbi:MAG: patatin family protein [Clostridia bacterium]|nr:patatin family protein [Clostridia bacterium]